MATTRFTQLDVYRITRGFPLEERFLLTSQMRRAAVSVPSNIAEGYGRRSPADKARFYTISQGSKEELSYHLILAQDLGYVKDVEALAEKLDHVGRMLRRLIETTLAPSS